MKKRFFRTVLSLILSLAALAPLSIAFAAYEDFGTWTEYDPSSKVLPSLNSIQWSGVARSTVAYVYDDRGADSISGDFQVTFTAKMTSHTFTDSLTYFSVSNNIGTWRDHIVVNKWNTIGFVESDGGGTPRWYLGEIYSGTTYADTTTDSDYFEPTADVEYYITLVRDETVGTYGTVYAYIYSDSDRTILVDTIDHTLHEKNDFRYIYGFQSYGTTGAGTAAGVCSAMQINLFTGAEYTPQVIAYPQLVLPGGDTQITGVFSSGDNITDSGIQWGTSTGVYTDNLTSDFISIEYDVYGDSNYTGYFYHTIDSANLTYGQHYYYRAYAENVHGIGYSTEKDFIYTPALLNVTTGTATVQYDIPSGNFTTAFSVTVEPDTADTVTAVLSTDGGFASGNVTMNLLYASDGVYQFDMWDGSYSYSLSANTTYYYQGRAWKDGVPYFGQIRSFVTTVPDLPDYPEIQLVEIKNVSDLYGVSYAYELTAKIIETDETSDIYNQGFQFSLDSTPTGTLLAPVYTYEVDNVAPDGTFTEVFDLSGTDWYHGQKMYFRAFIDTYDFSRLFSQTLSSKQAGDATDGDVTVNPNDIVNISDIVNDTRASLGLTGTMGTWAFLALVELVIALIFGMAFFGLKESASNSKILGVAIGICWLITSVAALGAFIFTGMLGIWPIVILTGGFVLLIILILSIKFSGGNSVGV